MRRELRMVSWGTPCTELVEDEKGPARGQEQELRKFDATEVMAISQSTEYSTVKSCRELR